jgi:hypothetical protein
LSIICFIYQLIELTLEFTEFKTTIHAEIISDDNLHFLDKPAISYCINQPFSRGLIKKNLNSTNNNGSQRLMAEFPKIINRLNVEERNISKYLTLTKNEMPPYIRCGNTEKVDESCIERNMLTVSLSNLSQCYTLNHSRYPINERWKYQNHSRILDIAIQSWFRGGNCKLLYHDFNQLPSLSFADRKVEDLAMIKVKRLPPPYDSNCFVYHNSSSFKSRGQCINDCVFKKILKKYNCIPRESISVLTFYENMTLDSTFCEDKKFEGFSEDDCSVSCLKPCEELFYSTFFLRLIMKQKILFIYIKFI